MKADLGIGEEVLLLSDGNGDFTRAIGCELDLSDKPIGLGVRSRRYAMFVEDGVVKVLNLEDGGVFIVSSVEDLLKALREFSLLSNVSFRVLEFDVFHFTNWMMKWGANCNAILC
ncbi:hypothetical protein SASPL_127744 [Salvia splendens]|uniref:glutaredoxin-dependent peroxiredoxin n=1 Tax=Salvia splendens TaxID=180675 RepID=A0A8X8XB67_SALSN|nr:hypothetical protein SASPL_127744 [Salvia splendens]